MNITQAITSQIGNDNPLHDVIVYPSRRGRRKQGAVPVNPLDATREWVLFLPSENFHRLISISEHAVLDKLKTYTYSIYDDNVCISNSLEGKDMSLQDNDGSTDVTHDRTGGNGNLTVEVYSPRLTQPKKFTWSKSLQIGQAADEAAKAFNYEAGTPTFLNKDGKVLDREKTLIESGVRDFDQLELTDKGGGV